MKKNYPWIVCFFCMLLNFVVVGMVTVAFSAFMPYLRDSIGLTNTETSMITTVRCLSTMIVMLFTTAYYKKFSLRMGTFLASLLIPVGYVIFAHANSAIACYIGVAVMGSAYGLGSMIPIAQIIRNWFKTQSSTALAITTCGSSISTAIMPPIITRFVERIGMQATFYTIGAFAVVCAVLIFLIIRDRPEELDMQPLESAEKVKEKVNVLHMDKKELNKVELAAFIVVMLLMGYTGTPYTHHLTIHYVTIGYTAIQAAFALSLYGAILAVAKIIFGMATDRYGVYKMNYPFIVAWAVSSFITMALNGGHTGLLYLTAVLNGIGIPLGTIGITIWTGDLSTDEEYVSRIRLSQTLFQLGSLVGSPIPGMIADATGSYALAYASFGVTLIVMLIIIQVLYKRHMVRQTA